VIATTPKKTLFVRKGKKEGGATLETLFADPVDNGKKNVVALGETHIEQRGVFTQERTKDIPLTNEVSPEDDFEPDLDDLPDPY
jgi:hypothetical protein